MFPVHRFNAEAATTCLKRFGAELTHLMQLSAPIHFAAVKHDNAKAFTGTHFQDFCDENVIRSVSSGDYAHQQMSRVERMNGVRMGMARTIGNFSRLDRTNWPYFVTQSDIVCNKLAVLSHGGDIPEQVLTSQPVSWQHVHICGLACTFWLDPAQRGESSKSLVDRARQGIYLAKCHDKSSHHILVPASVSPHGNAYVTTSFVVRAAQLQSASAWRGRRLLHRSRCFHVSLRLRRR